MALVGGGGKGITESIREIISGLFPQLFNVLAQTIHTYGYLPIRIVYARASIRDYGVQYLGNKGAEEKTQWRIY